MNTWVMQYRTRPDIEGEWSEWKDLPESLTFSSYYHPLYFEFRVRIEGPKPAFAFYGTPSSVVSLLPR